MIDIASLDLFSFSEIFTLDFLNRAITGTLVFIIGYVLLVIVNFLVRQLTLKKLSEQSIMVIQKIIKYSGLFIIVIVVLHQFGVKLSALLGAAGIIGIALGFAAQTSVANIISGLFLIGEKPFEVGDLISLGDKRGIVLSIDLLSVKIRTTDNQFIRVPNENIIKTEVTNITRFPIRRIDIQLGVAYKEDIRHVLEILKDIATQNPLILDEPEPFIMFKSFGESSLDIQYGLWIVKEDWQAAKTEIMLSIKERFDAEGIEIPFPHRTLYAGSQSGPMRIAVTDPLEENTGVTKDTL